MFVLVKTNCILYMPRNVTCTDILRNTDGQALISNREYSFYLCECHSVLYARLQQSESGLHHLIEFGVATIMGICVRFELMSTCACSGGWYMCLF